MPSALRLYLRSSSTWMLVSGRKSRGARLAGRSRLTKTRDRMRTEMKSPARRGGALGGPGRRGGGPFTALGKSCSLYGGGVSGGRVPRELAKVWHGSLWVKLVRDWSSGVRGWMLFVSLGEADEKLQVCTLGQESTYQFLKSRCICLIIHSSTVSD